MGINIRIRPGLKNSISFKDAKDAKAEVAGAKRVSKHMLGIPVWLPLCGQSAVLDHHSVQSSKYCGPEKNWLDRWAGGRLK